MGNGPVISWCSAMGELPRMNEGQRRRAKTLIRRLCANYDGGNCLRLDDGDLHPCPQLITPVPICKYFRAAVLPADPELNAEVMGVVYTWKNCTLCGKPFIARSNRAKYCAKCAQQERRRKTRGRVRRHRGGM